MSISAHVLTRIYGQAFGTPPFQNSSGQATLTNLKTFPVAPNTQVPLAGATLWPLENGIQVNANYYVYSVIELPPQGLNQPSIKLVTDKSVTTLASDAT